MRFAERIRSGARAVPMVVLSALLAMPATAATWRIVDLGGVPLGSGAFSVTPTGFAAGYEMLAPQLPHATRFDHGRVLDLGTLGGDASLANAVNAAGAVVGWARRGDESRHAFLYRDGAMQDLGTLGGTNSVAFAINDAGLVAGSSYLAGDTHQVPFVWTAAEGQRALEVPGLTEGQALALNASGAAVGWMVDTTHTRAFVADGAGVRLLPDFGAAAKAYGISDNGLVVGYAVTNAQFPKFHAVIWRGDIVHDFGALEGGHSVAYAVNRNGTVVGFTYRANDEMVAAIFSDDGILDLNSALPPGSDWHLDMATGITAEGVISGAGTLAGTPRAFALVPQGVESGPWGLTFATLRLRAYPSPMFAGGRLELELPAATHGRVTLFDVAGRRLALLADGEFPAGRVSIAVPGDLVRRMEPGVYYARLETERANAVGRVIVMR